MGLINLAIESIFIQNILLSLFLGMCSYLAQSKKMESAKGLGLAVILVLTIATPLNWLIRRFLLAPGALSWTGIDALNSLDLSFLTFICFIAVIASLVQIVEMAIKKLSPTLFRQLGIFLPLMTTNCAILGLAIFQINRGYDFLQGLTFAIGAGLGLTLALVLMASIRETIEFSDVPNIAKGTGLVLIIAGTLSMAFMGFAGLL